MVEGVGMIFMYLLFNISKPVNKNKKHCYLETWKAYAMLSRAITDLVKRVLVFRVCRANFAGHRYQPDRNCVSAPPYQTIGCIDITDLYCKGLRGSKNGQF